MSSIHNAYARGFATKCAEYGVDPAKLVKQSQALNGIGNLLASMFYATPANDVDRFASDPESVTKTKAYLDRARNNFRNTGKWTKGLFKRIGGKVTGDNAGAEAGKSMMQQAGNPIYRR